MGTIITTCSKLLTSKNDFLQLITSKNIITWNQYIYKVEPTLS